MISHTSVAFIAARSAGQGVRSVRDGARPGQPREHQRSSAACRGMPAEGRLGRLAIAIGNQACAQRDGDRWARADRCRLLARMDPDLGQAEQAGRPRVCSRRLPCVWTLLAAVPRTCCAPSNGSRWLFSDISGTDMLLSYKR